MPPSKGCRRGPYKQRGAREIPPLAPNPEASQPQSCSIPKEPILGDMCPNPDCANVGRSLRAPRTPKPHSCSPCTAWLRGATVLLCIRAELKIWSLFSGARVNRNQSEVNAGGNSQVAAPRAVPSIPILGLGGVGCSWEKVRGKQTIRKPMAQHYWGTELRGLFWGTEGPRDILFSVTLLLGHTRTP